MGLGIAPGVAHTVVEAGGVCVVVLQGEIDLATAGEIDDAVRSLLAPGRCSRIRVDLSAVTFLDCAGVRALLEARRQAARKGVEFGIVHAHDGPRKVLMLTGVYGYLRERMD
jgi:anti-anti-sigma factor